MSGKWRWVAGAAVLALGLATQPLEAQRGRGVRGPGAPGTGGPFLGQSVNIALENQGQLQLNEDQVAQLQDMKAILDGQVAELTAEMKTLRESIKNGDVEWDEGQRQMGVLRGELISASSPLQGRVREILTVEQHSKLQPLVWQNRPGLGRGAAIQGQGRASFRGRGIGGRGMGQPGGTRGLMNRWPGSNQQGRVPAVGFRRGAPRMKMGLMGRRAPLFRRGIRGTPPGPGGNGGLF
jgi:hypothetical protein